MCPKEQHLWLVSFPTDGTSTWILSPLCAIMVLPSGMSVMAIGYKNWHKVRTRKSKDNEAFSLLVKPKPVCVFAVNRDLGTFCTRFSERHQPIMYGTHTRPWNK